MPLPSILSVTLQCACCCDLCRATPAIYALNDEYRKIADEERKVHFVDCHDRFLEFKDADRSDSSDASDSSELKQVLLLVRVHTISSIILL